jgi:hypothetical protein
MEKKFMKYCIDCNQLLTETNMRLDGKYILQRCKKCHGTYRIKYKVDINCSECGQIFKIAKQRFNKLWRCIDCAKRFNRGAGRINNVNDFYFSEITIENSYWAGFLAADGCLQQGMKNLSLGLQHIDLGHLEKFKSNINFKGKIHTHTYFHKQLKKNYTFSNMTITSPRMCEDLKTNFNLTPKKSLTLKPPINLNFEQSLSYIKGYIDGDGCIDTSGNMNLKIHGTEEVMIWIKTILNTITKGGSIWPRKNIFIYSITGFYAMEVLPIILNSVSLGLERKWGKVINHKRIYRNADTRIWSIKEKEVILNNLNNLKAIYISLPNRTKSAIKAQRQILKRTLTNDNANKNSVKSNI